MKLCIRCNLEKKEDEFHKDKSKKDGLYPICKKCRNKNEKQNPNKKKIDFYVKKSMIRSLKNNTHGIWEKVINIKLEELKEHLEKQFDNKMSWDNYGSYWGVNHIIPKKYFKYSTFRSNEFLKCWNIKNLQPLPLTECRKSGIFNEEKVLNYNLLDILPIGALHLTNLVKIGTLK